MIADAVYRQRKFSLAIISLLLGFAGLLLDKVTGDSFVWVVGLVLGLYGSANVAEKTFGGQGAGDPL